VKRFLPLVLVACAHAQPLDKPLPPLEIRTLDGAKVVRLDELRGPALIDLWATWCVPCLRTMPFYAKLAKDTGLRVIAISVDVSGAPVKEWIAQHPAPFEWLRDPDGVAAERLGVIAMPTSFLIDAQGRVRARHDGFREEDQALLEKEVRALLRSQ
jgi:thiol-disulfide isomerase/thioredoxin